MELILNLQVKFDVFTLRKNNLYIIIESIGMSKNKERRVGNR